MIAQGQLKMDAMDLGKKSAVEKELEVSTRSHSFFVAPVELSLTARSERGKFFTESDDYSIASATRSMISSY